MLIETEQRKNDMISVQIILPNKTQIRSKIAINKTNIIIIESKLNYNI